MEFRQDNIFHDGNGGDVSSSAIDVKDRAFVVHDVLASRFNSMVRRFVDWTGRSSFLMVIFAFVIMFIILTMILALFIMLNLRMYPDCVTAGESPYEDLSPSGKFHDAWILSWTTFSTAGYGVIAPSIQNPCYSLNFFCSWISFIGTVFSGFCAALIFSRIQSVQGEAPVKFSDVIKVKLERHSVKTHAGKSGSIDKSDMKDEYVPVITFDMSNLFHTKVTGEIIEGKINVMANVDAFQVDEETRQRAGNMIFPNMLSPLRSEMSKQISGEVTSHSRSPMEMIKGIFSQSVVSREINGPDDAGNKIRSEESDPSTIFTKLAVSPDENPFFRVEWPVSHILDDSSPLLTNACKEKLKKGKLPRNTMDKIHYIEDNIVFHEILVTFTGLANVSAESVFATKVYTFENLKFSPPISSISEFNNMDEEIITDVAFI